MSTTPYLTNINGLSGYYLFNTHQLSYDECISLPSVRVHNPIELKQTIIYKYIPLKYLLVLLKEERLILNRVSSWEDPYENFFLKQRFVKPGDLKSSYFTSVEDQTKGLYGMSWTLQDESDSLWRIYSPDKLSVRISCSVERLIETVSSEDNQWGVWVDKVHYMSKRNMNSWLKDCKSVASFDQFIEKMSESFFIKRKAFKAEKEFRVIVNFFKKDTSSFVCFRCDPRSLIDSYFTDPRLNKYESKAVRTALIDCGVDENKIQASNLYRFKPRKVEMTYDPFQDW